MRRRDIWEIQTATPIQSHFESTSWKTQEIKSNRLSFNDLSSKKNEYTSNSMHLHRKTFIWIIFSTIPPPLRSSTLRQSMHQIIHRFRRTQLKQNHPHNTRHKTGDNATPRLVGPARRVVRTGRTGSTSRTASRTRTTSRRTRCWSSRSCRRSGSLSFRGTGVSRRDLITRVSDAGLSQSGGTTTAPVRRPGGVDTARIAEFVTGCFIISK